jgi:antitoxin (DNA-binding transcriptional repressor) of toxin-antitoxin stability system
MKRVKIAELKDHLSAHLRAVESGAEIEVADRDRPIARLVPVPSQGPRLRIRPPRVRFALVRDKRHRPARWPVDSLDLLLEERRER